VTDTQEPPPKATLLLRDLSTSVRELSRGSIDSIGLYGLSLRAAVAKATEFATFAWSDPSPSHPFFMTATLRGVCEDLIVLSFLERLSPADRVESVKLLARLNLTEGVASQVAFFDAERPWQPVVSGPVETEVVEREIRAFSERAFSWKGRQAWPSVWHMAKECGMTPLYAYLYSATSRWVHFTPQLLLRMGWGGGPEDNSSATEWKFTTTNFEPYYIDFNRTYALYLLIRLLRGPGRALLIALPDLKLVDDLEETLEDILRWPEAVTFEELNLKGPPPIMRILYKAAGKAGASER